MDRFRKVFKLRQCNVIGMIHVDPLPGTPKHNSNGNSWQNAIEKARHEAHLYEKYKLDSVLLENMHDVPYVKENLLGPEIVGCMTRLACEVKSVLTEQTPCGIQILACGNRQALAVAKAADLQYIRAEAYVFGHVGDEGYADACAGEILRYRKQINADNVLIFTDLKKKHSSHAITQDVSLLETAKAAEFFLTDGIVITGQATGHAANLDDVAQLVNGKVKSPLLIGSGVTRENIKNYFDSVHAVIIGSHFKIGNSWDRDICERSVDEFMRTINDLRKRCEKQ